MSWLSNIKNSFIAALTATTPTAEQAPVHTAANGVAGSIATLGAALETAAVDVVETAITAKLGPAGGVLAYDFLSALIAAATKKQTAVAQPAPTAPAG